MNDEPIVHYDWEEEIGGKPKKKEPKSVTPKAPKKKTNKTNKSNYYIILSIIAAAIVIGAAIYFRPIIEEPQPTVPVVALVNGEQITLEQLNELYEITVPTHLRGLVQKDQYLESSLVPQLLLVQEARELGLSTTEEDISLSIERFKTANGLTDETYNDRLSAANITLTEMREFYRHQILILKLVNTTILPEITVTENEVERYYDDNSEQFAGRPDYIRASHILLNSSEEAHSVLALIEGGADFETVAMERSLDPSARTNRGNLGFFTRGAMVAPFEEAAFALEVGELSDPVETQFGHHLILRQPDIVTLEEARPLIENTIRAGKQESLFRTHIDQLRASADVEIFPGGQILAEQVPDTFSETGDPTCNEDGKPVVRMYSTSDCPSCEWIRATYESVVEEFVFRGDIVAYHWQLDTGDNLLTAEIEDKIPREEVEIFNKYNPSSTVPTFVFGCEYVRPGNGHEKEQNLVAEENEFRKIIRKI